MHCATAKADFDVDYNGEPRVALVLGAIRRVGAFHEDAWAFLTPDEAEDLANDLRAMATKARAAKSKTT